MELTIQLAERHAACPDLLKGFLDRIGCDPAKVKAGVKTTIDRNMSNRQASSNFFSSMVARGLPPLMHHEKRRRRGMGPR